MIEERRLTHGLLREAAGTFELQARPYSEWINAFTLDEWVAFGYLADLAYYYCAG